MLENASWSLQGPILRIYTGHARTQSHHLNLEGPGGDAFRYCRPQLAAYCANMHGTHAKVPPWTWWSMGADGMHVGSAGTSFTHTCANTQSTQAQVPPKWGPGGRLALWKCSSVLQPPNAQKTKGTHAKVPPETRSSGRWARWECILILQAPTSRIYAQHTGHAQKSTT